MLVLTRKIGERIQIGDNVVITLVNVHGRRCRLGIDAPAHMLIRREELPGAGPTEKGRAGLKLKEAVAG
jgi:carbon storage regulator